MTTTLTRTILPASEDRDILTRIATWIERRRQRQALGELNDRLLKDLGLSRADVDQEQRKPFWQA